ncbi:MAG: ParB/RepB/Spo0J family partition protein [Caenispirillum sp.]|nr:ParB/RepB/Spo0J family partition protein [Caenispirillum sp.]
MSHRMLEGVEDLGPAEALALLDSAWEGPLEEVPEEVPLEKLEVLPQVFQLRGRQEPDADHVWKLQRIVLERGPLDPVEVVHVAGRFFVVDGHHRVEAYREAGWRKQPVPVRVIPERPSRAALRAGAANSRLRLQMREWERSEAAWKLVNLGSNNGAGTIRYSKAEIARAASVSERTVANMRKVRRTLLEEHPGVDPAGLMWLSAKALAEGRSDECQPMTEEELERLAQEYARRMERHLGPRFARNPEIAAKALLAFTPRGAAAIAQAVLHEVGMEEEPEEEVQEDF